jgi:hypothetical protein
MRLVSLTWLYDFMKVLNIKVKFSTKNEHLSRHIPFTTIYLLHEQKLNHSNYSEKEINMGDFVQSTDNYVHMYEKFGDFNSYECL